MGFFHKKSEKQLEQAFTKVFDDWVSNGSFYKMSEEVKAANEKAKIGSNFTLDDSGLSEIDNKLLSFTNETTIPKFYIYMQLNHFFTNLFSIKCNDYELLQEIQKMRMIAFFAGDAGLYWNAFLNKWKAVAIVKADKYESWDEIKEYQISYDYNFEMDRTQQKHRNVFKVNKDDLIYYQFRSSGLSCWVWLREYVNSMNRLMGQVSACNLISNKIISFTQENANESKAGILSFLNPNRYYIYSRNSNRLMDTVKFLDEFSSNELPLKYLEIYKQTMDIFNEWFGIKDNTEFKKERNTVAEVEAGSFWTNILQKDLFFNLSLFVKKLNSHLKNKEVVELSYEV